MVDETVEGPTVDGAPVVGTGMVEVDVIARPSDSF